MLFLYSKGDTAVLLAADRLMREAEKGCQLPQPFGLLAATGLRVWEGLRLNVDRNSGISLITIPKPR